MGTGSARPVKPLCKPKFLANSIIGVGEVLRDLGQPVPQECQRSRKSLEQESHDFFARKLWEFGDRLYNLTLDQRIDWGSKWFQLKGALREEPKVSSMVYIRDANWGARYSRGVGQLMFIDRLLDMPGQPRLYEQDGGPARFSERYGIKLLDGTMETWTNCSVRRLPCHYLTAMMADIYERYRERETSRDSGYGWGLNDHA